MPNSTNQALREAATSLGFDLQFTGYAFPMFVLTAPSMVRNCQDFDQAASVLLRQALRQNQHELVETIVSLMTPYVAAIALAQDDCHQAYQAQLSKLNVAECNAIRLIIQNTTDDACVAMLDAHVLRSSISDAAIVCRTSKRI